MDKMNSEGTHEALVKGVKPGGKPWERAGWRATGKLGGVVQEHRVQASSEGG